MIGVVLANPLGSTVWKETVLGLFVIGSTCGVGVVIAAVVGCAIVGQLSCTMSILFDSFERVKGVGGKVGLSDAIADGCWFCWGQAASLSLMLAVVNKGLLPALLVARRGVT